MASTADKIAEYVGKWKRQGYPEDIPDEIPAELMHDNLAPSYKAIALALLRNEHGLESLGFTPPTSLWYSALKRVELADREYGKDRECLPHPDLFEAIANAK